MTVSCTTCNVQHHPSSFAAFPQHNDPLHGDDARQWRDIILEHLDHINHLDGKIKSAPLPADIQKFIKDRGAVMVRVVQCIGLFSRVRRLPPEILGQIFMFTVHSQDFRSRWNLVRVCRKWCTVALSLPALWSNIIVHPRSTAHQLEAQLVWSSEAPLDVVLTDIWDDSKAHLLNLIADQAFRWRTVKLGTVLRMLECLERSKGRIPMLKELRIICFVSESPPRMRYLRARAELGHRIRSVR